MTYAPGVPIMSRPGETGEEERMSLNSILSYGACVAAGVAIGHHFGVIDGIAAALAIYAVMPYRAVHVR